MFKVFLPFIKKKRRLVLGTAFHPGFFSDIYVKTVLNNFKIVTPEAGGCYYWVYGKEFNYGWNCMDTIYKFAIDNGLDIHYAHLRWWFKDQPPDIFSWIHEAMSRYPKIRDWTVCNEAFWDTLETYSLINESFEYAKELRNLGIVRKDARLFYNGLFIQKTEQESVKNLINIGLVDAVGIQMHHNILSSFDIYIPFLEWLNTNKIPWRISEMDVEIPEATEYYLSEQSKQYETATNLLKEYNGENLGVWGVCDKYSWLGDHPLLFDANFNPKPAFYAIMKDTPYK